MSRWIEKWRNVKVVKGSGSFGGMDNDKKIKLYGYCRISTPKQSIDRQVRNILKVYPDAHIIKEIYTGTKLYGRSEWKKLYAAVLREVEKGNRIMIIFDSVSRMSRDAEEGFALYEVLFQKGVELVFLKEPHINTETYQNAIQNTIGLTGTTVDYILEGVNKYLMELAKEQIRLAFEQAEKEVKDLHLRTKEGIETARLNGKQIGIQKGTKLVTKKSIHAKEIIRTHNKSFGGTLNDKETQALAGVSRGTFYKYKRELFQEMQ